MRVPVGQISHKMYGRLSLQPPVPLPDTQGKTDDFIVVLMALF